MTSSSSGAAPTVDLDAVADAVVSCSSVLGIASGRRSRTVRIVDRSVEVHVVARWGAFLPDVADEVRAAVRPLVGSHQVTVYIDDLARET